MTEKRRKTIVYGILVVAVIWGIWNNPFSADKKEKSAESKSTPIARSAVGPVETADAKSGAFRVADVPDWKDDPFVRRKMPRSRVARTTEKPVEFKLSAISRSGGGTMAIIDGQIVNQGGAIDGWTVASIDDNSVLLKKGSENIELNLRRR